MINVKIQLEGLNQVENLIKRIRRQLRVVPDQVAGDVGKEATKRIRRAVKGGNIYPALRPGTLRKREMGKVPGAGGPVISTYRGRRAMYRSGSMFRAIRFKKERRGHWQMYIDPVFGEYSGGKFISLALIAYLQETGFNLRIPVTYRMLRYLHVLARGGAKPSSRKGFKSKSTVPDGKTGRVISCNVPPRPVFTLNFDQIQPSQFDAWIEESLIKRLRVL